MLQFPLEWKIRCARFFVPPQIAHFPAFLALKNPCTFPKTGRRKNYQNSFCAKILNSVQKFAEYASTFAQNYAFFLQNCAFFCGKSLLPHETLILMYNQLKYALFGIKDQTQLETINKFKIWKLFVQLL